MVYDFSFPRNIFLLGGYPMNMQSDRYMKRRLRNVSYNRNPNSFEIRNLLEQDFSLSFVEP